MKHYLLLHLDCPGAASMQEHALCHSLQKRTVLSAAATKRKRMRQSKRQAQVCEPVVISSNEDMGEVCNLEIDKKMLIFRYLSLEYSLCSLFIITMHFLLLQIYHHHISFSPSTEADQ